MANIRLDLNDKNESTVYLNEDRAPITVSASHNIAHMGRDDIECQHRYYIDFEFHNGNRTGFVYDDEDQRNVDLRYVLNQLDELLGIEINKEEF